MTRCWTRHLAGALAAALVLPGLVLMTDPAGAGEPSAPTPKAFSADMAKTAKAGESLLVHPSQVAANRVTLASLVATNVLGQNTPAIAAMEAHYAEMWAQDVTAMLGYHRGAVSDQTEPTLQMKATAVLEKVDADVAKTCPSDEKAFTRLTTLEKKKDRAHEPSP